MAGIVELQSVFDIHFNCKKIWQFYSSMNPQPSDLWKSLVFQLCSITSANWYKQMYAMTIYTWVQSNKRQNPAFSGEWEQLDKTASSYFFWTTKESTFPSVSSSRMICPNCVDNIWISLMNSLLFAIMFRWSPEAIRASMALVCIIGIGQSRSLMSSLSSKARSLLMIYP